MQQSTLWHDTIFDALGGAVQAAGGTKRVAAKLWPTLDVSTAAARLRAGLNPDHAQKLDPDEQRLIARMGKEAGDHSVMEFLARDLGYEIKPLKAADSKRRARRARKLALLAEIRRLEDEEQLEDEE
jgi:hypothetical protein